MFFRVSLGATHFWKPSSEQLNEFRIYVSVLSILAAMGFLYGAFHIRQHLAHSYQSTGDMDNVDGNGPTLTDKIGSELETLVRLNDSSSVALRKAQSNIHNSSDETVLFESRADDISSNHPILETYHINSSTMDVLRRVRQFASQLSSLGSFRVFVIMNFLQQFMYVHSSLL